MPFSTVRLAILLLTLGNPVLAESAIDADTAFKTEALARWGYMNCPQIRIHPMILMVAAMVAERATKEQLDASHARFDAEMDAGFATTDAACTNVAKILIGPSKGELMTPSKKP